MKAKSISQKRKRKRLSYSINGKTGGGLEIYILPKEQRPHGVDGIEIVWMSGREAKQKKDAHSVRIKDWEALCLIEGLTRALLDKKKIFG